MWMLKIGLGAIAVGIALCGATAGDGQISGRDIIRHLGETIAWYEHMSAADQPATATQNVLLQDRVRESSKQVIRKAFAFARAEAALAGNQPKAGAGKAANQSRTLEQSAAAANERIRNLQNRIADLNGQIARARKRQLATLTAQRDTLAADLAFAKVAQNGLKNILQFANAPEQRGGVLGQIQLLANSDSIPAALSDAAEPKPAAPSSTSPGFHPESAGIAPLIANSLELLRARSQVGSLIGETDRLDSETRTLLTPLRTQLRTLINQSDALAAATSNESDPNRLATIRQQIESFSARFKTLSAPILPLSEQGIAVGVTRVGLTQWQNAIGRQLQNVLGYVALRLGGFALAILVLLVLSRIVHKATFRYVRDTRRRRQFVLIRRVVVGGLATLIAILASVSGIGSFATVAGFVTAGLAVALQNVILSVVAYFFLIGRYGLRSGDRVTVSGLTGQVLEVGLVRFYLMELAGAGTDVHSTGRVAVFSNSVIFQPAALIKQAPGTEYTWHSVSTILSQEADLEEARKRVGSAVESVFHDYQAAIERQHEAFEKAANIQISTPAPVSRGRFTDAGVEITVRYPVGIQDMSQVDEKVVDAVMKETNSEPPMKIAPGGYPKIVAAT